MAVTRNTQIDERTRRWLCGGSRKAYAYGLTQILWWKTSINMWLWYQWRNQGKGEHLPPGAELWERKVRSESYAVITKCQISAHANNYDAWTEFAINLLGVTNFVWYTSQMLYLYYCLRFDDVTMFMPPYNDLFVKMAKWVRNYGNDIFRDHGPRSPLDTKFADSSSRCRSRRESEFLGGIGFGFQNPLGGVGVGFFCPTLTPEAQLNQFLHYTLIMGIRVELLQFLLKVSLKHN